MKLLEAPGQEYWKCYFIELHPVSKGIAVDPEVLWKPAIFFLPGGEIDQSTKRGGRISRRQKTHGGFDHVTRPDEVVTAFSVLVVSRIAPGNSHRCHEGALKQLVLMGQQEVVACIEKTPFITACLF